MKRPGLTRARIVATALELADREGLDAVTLRRVAAELGVHVTSLYNHVPTKEAVLDGMIERLVADARLPKSAIPWDEWVRRFASSMRAVARRHPGAFAVFHTRPIQGPEAAAYAEAALAAFCAGGFDVGQAYGAVKATTNAVLGLVLEDVAHRQTPGLRTDTNALSRDAFPRLHAANAIATKADTSSYLIDALIAGFEATRRGPRQRGSPGRDRQRATTRPSGPRPPGR
jgi:AcrR family transcriptional regulator